MHLVSENASSKIDHVGSVDLVAFLTSHGISQEGYHYEVWGDHSPIVQKELEEIKQATEAVQLTIGDGPPIRRLRMLLQHMKE